MACFMIKLTKLVLMGKAAIILIFLFCPMIFLGQDNNSPQKLLSRLAQSPDDTNRVVLLQELCLFYIRKPNEDPHDLDSAILLAQQSEDLSRKINYQKGMGDSYRYRFYAMNERGRPAEAKEFIQRAIDVYKKNNYYTELGESYHALGTCYSIEDEQKLKTRIQHEENALESYLKTGNLLDQAGSYRQLGELYMIAEDMPNSIRNLKQSLTFYQQANYRELQGIYDLVSQYYRVVGNFDESVKYGLLAIKTAESVGDTSLQMCTLYNHLALSYYVFNDFSASKYYFLQALAVAKRYNDGASINIITPNAAMALNRLKQGEDAIRLLEETKKSHPPKSLNESVAYDYMFVMSNLGLNRIESARPYASNLLRRDGISGISGANYRRMYSGIIEFCLADKNYNKAGLYLEKLGGRPDLEIKERVNIENWAFKIDSVTGNHISAIRHYQRYKALNDSAFNESKTRQIEQLKIAYETEKKDQELQIKEKNIQLLTNEKDLQQVILGKARLTKNLILIGTLLLLLLFLLLYSRYRLKQRAHLELENKQRLINDKNEKLQKLVHEKEWLLKEIHHRVKNNLHTVMSLLNSQSAYLKDEAAMTAIRDSRNRVNSMSLIHQKLYQSDNLATIDMGDYIREMTQYLKESYQKESGVRFSIAVDPLKLDVTQAVPLGLVLNEAITNAIKYAFPDNDGRIDISLKAQEDGNYLLTVADDGIGLPPDFDRLKLQSLGMSLMQGLSEDIDGKFELLSGRGTTIRITFCPAKTFREKFNLDEPSSPQSTSIA